MHIALGWEYRGHRVQKGDLCSTPWKAAPALPVASRRGGDVTCKTSPKPTLPFYLIDVGARLVQDHAEAHQSASNSAPASRYHRARYLEPLDAQQTKVEHHGGIHPRRRRLARGIRLPRRHHPPLRHCRNRPRGHTRCRAPIVQIAIERDRRATLLLPSSTPRTATGASSTSRLEPRRAWRR